MTAAGMTPEARSHVMIVAATTLALVSVVLLVTHGAEARRDADVLLTEWKMVGAELLSEWAIAGFGPRGVIVVKLGLVLLVVAGAIPITSSFYQFALVGLHRHYCHYERVEPFTPQTAIVVPAWNEGLVIAETIDQLMRLEYPRAALRIYVVDDASTDDTPDIIRGKERQYPGNVFHLRRENGGQGKAHTLNHGLRQILAQDWCEAVLIIDADVRFEPDSLAKMTRHLADPQVGAVTAYIKEGSAPGNYMTKFIAFEYITAQAASRRAQNAIGAMACLAGGAQLLSRENLEAIGGQIDTSSLAEDTFTTFKTQLGGRRAVFEGNATVWAEEPCDILGLWKQRLRWARGNVQLTRHYRDLWFRGGPSRLSGVLFGYLWFSIFLMPVFMILAATGLVALYFVDFPLSWLTFRLLWIVNAVNYMFVTGFSFAIDPQTARKSWRQGVLFPGLVSLTIILYSCFPPLFERALHGAMLEFGLISSWMTGPLILFLYAWLALCMPVAYVAKVIEKLPRVGCLSWPLVYLAGYGPLLCTVTFASYVMEARGAEMKWDKTVKTGKVAVES
jgi:cellulose synthase/poly-beta-1,6-N-acetylglucosamine synthase-like glycosyltransferase